MRNRSARNSLYSVAAALAALLGAASSAAAAGGGSKLDIGDLGHAIAAVLVFLALLAVLGKWAWGPIISQLRQREERIATSIDRAKTREDKAQQLLGEYEQRIAQANAEAGDVLAQARTHAAELRDQTVSAARAESQRFARQARREIAQAHQEALRELRRTTAMLTVDVAASVIGKNIDPADHKRLIDESLEDIGRYVRDES